MGAIGIHAPFASSRRLDWSCPAAAPAPAGEPPARRESRPRVARARRPRAPRWGDRWPRGSTSRRSRDRRGSSRGGRRGRDRRGPWGPRWRGRRCASRAGWPCASAHRPGEQRAPRAADAAARRRCRRAPRARRRRGRPSPHGLVEAVVAVEATSDSRAPRVRRSSRSTWPRRSRWASPSRRGAHRRRGHGSGRCPRRRRPRRPELALEQQGFSSRIEGDHARGAGPKPVANVRALPTWSVAPSPGAATHRSVDLHGTGVRPPTPPLRRSARGRTAAAARTTGGVTGVRCASPGAASVAAVSAVSEFRGMDERTDLPRGARRGRGRSAEQPNRARGHGRPGRRGVSPPGDRSRRRRAGSACLVPGPPLRVAGSFSPWPRGARPPCSP